MKPNFNSDLVQAIERRLDAYIDELYRQAGAGCPV